jgi:hypothetical protein
MAEFREQLTPERLLEAAEAALNAANENAEFTGGKMPYPADLMGTPVQPDSLAPFTRWEIEQASEFLVRMGMIPAPARKNPA